MEYAGRYSVANPSRDTYDRYLESLAVFVVWLLDHDYDVKLLLGDAHTLAVDDLMAVLRKRLAPNTAERVTYRPTNSAEELLSQLSETDLVVATAFHNVLLSLLLTKPVIAISFHHKSSSLMNETGLSEYCHDINEMNADTLIEQFQALATNADDVKQQILQRVEAFERALDEQYELLFGDAINELRAADAATAPT
jgi:polysaccharide pyruvyl transferase WcaK-like protein